MDEIRARVVAQERGLYRISDGSDEIWAEVSGRFIHDAVNISDYPAVGDYVVTSWPAGDSHGIISSVFPRKSLFLRKAAGSGHNEQVVAANIDRVFICMSLNNDYNLRRLERYVSMAWDSGATPVVVLTKKDLCCNLEEKVSEVELVAAGIDVVAISSQDDDYDQVMDYIKPDKTIAFIGSSGVGKSTLINKLIGCEQIATNGLRNDDRGRHTTTHRELIALDMGAYLIDTPGMRELGMWDSEEGIETTFADIEELAELCRFGNCSHTSEPGCAIRLAIEEGRLDENRWQSYQKLMAENEYLADSQGYLEAKEKKFKGIAKELKNMKRFNKEL